LSKTTITAEPGIPQVIITREFDAPRDLVFRAHTDPDLLVRWLCPRDLTTAIDHYDARDGGTWRYVQTDRRGRARPRLPADHAARARASAWPSCLPG
jgi:uncharacterized protein YndB with AHSA1/START domain